MYGVYENIAFQFTRTLLRAALIFRGQKNQIMNIVFIKQSMKRWKKYIEDEVSIAVCIMHGCFKKAMHIFE